MPPKGKSGSGKGGKGRAAETIRERGVGKKKGGSRPAAMGVISLAAGGQPPPPEPLWFMFGVLPVNQKI